MWVGQTSVGKSSKSASSTMWYSFDIGTVHVVAISTEVYCENPENAAAQYSWLEKDLQAATSRADKPWIVVLGHRPLYQGQTSTFYSRVIRLGVQCTDSTLTNCNFLTPCESGLNCAYSIQHLLSQYKVDMYNSGHEHFYLRNNPISQNLTYESHPDPNEYKNPQNTIHIISGAAGIAHSPSFQETTVAPIESVVGAHSPSVVQDNSFSFSILLAFNNSHINYQQISAVDGSIIDDFWIIKSQKSPNFKVVDFSLKSDNSQGCD